MIRKVGPKFQILTIKRTCRNIQKNTTNAHRIRSDYVQSQNSSNNHLLYVMDSTKIWDLDALKIAIV